MTKSRGGGVFDVFGRCSFRVMTPGYAEVTFTIDFSISFTIDFFHFANIAGCACVFHFGTFRGNFKHYDWPHLIPCTNNSQACLIFYTLDKDDDGFFTKALSN